MATRTNAFPAQSKLSFSYSLCLFPAESSDEDQHPRATRKHRRSLGAGHPHGNGSPGPGHGEPDVLKDELQLYGDAPGEVVPSGESGEVEASQLRRLNIKKDDEFFHFVLLCFAIGALLVCYHYYADWFMSLGVGLLTFASLETVGIYFGLAGSSFRRRLSIQERTQPGGRGPRFESYLCQFTSSVTLDEPCSLGFLNWKIGVILFYCTSVL
ncbi:transmembrane protein 40 isoform X2 [Piliocolobus tephrosceles]|uniref:transmembrane protein 40 isoform X2 n=1 Tax=Piliocolobus tephrosceles TaxID=591936 RepID=UPI000E6AEC55|nr:transmembrane protein 40 isoform X2 [Piliocolobus tephrosceles]